MCIFNACRLGAVAAQVQGLVGRFSELDKKLMDIDESARDNKLRLKSATSAFLPTSVFDIPKIACPIPHFRCRESPYIGTNIKRARVPDNKVNWTVSTATASVSLNHLPPKYPLWSSHRILITVWLCHSIFRLQILSTVKYQVVINVVVYAWSKERNFPEREC